MMNRRMLAAVAIVAWALLAAAFGWMMLRSYATPEPDGRTAIRVTPAEREFVLTQMRAMLVTVQRVSDGLASANREQVVAAARASGEAGMIVQPALMLKFPPPFKQLSTQLHDGFDALATAAQANAPLPELLGKMSAQLGTCVACHAAYRLDAGSAP
jgi:cytochrome c556